MKLTVLELPAAWGEPARVLADVERRLAAHAPGELVLLPEAALHGYVSRDGDFGVDALAEPLASATGERCAAIARAHATHLVAPFALREGAAVFNAMVCWDPGGDVAFIYRKRHPWFPETWATPGPAAPPVVTIAGVVVTIAVCYDVHFLDDDAAEELAAADLLLFPSAWVEEPDHRVARLSPLARRHGVAIANANWAPGIVRVPGQGGSCVIARDGSVLARAPRSASGGRIDLELEAPARAAFGRP